MNITFKQKDCPKCGGKLRVLVDGISAVNEDGTLGPASDLDVLSVSCEAGDWDAETEDEVATIVTRHGERSDRMSEHDATVRRLVMPMYDCKAACGKTHTRDEVILRANGDMLDAIDAIPELTEENAEALHTVRGGILHALDELQLLEVEGFKHPDEPSDEVIDLVPVDDETDDVSDEQRVWRAANEDRGSIQLARRG